MPDIFDLPRAPGESLIVVAMSGGVDSSVVAMLAARSGARVVGVTMQLYDHGEAVKRSGACCAGQDIYDAKTVCDRLGIPHYVLDYESRFRDGVIAQFADAYAAGRTPIPCSSCNQSVKFTDLIAFARELGADCLATGHYVRRVVREGRIELWKGRDPARDQSYFLYGTTAEQLAFVRFPLGDLPKAEVRALAAEAGLIVADKPDSQDICFVPDGDYASLVKRLRPETAAPGEIVHVDGRVLGQHGGVVHYTIGQRRGLEIGGQAEPLYVVRLEPEERRVIVGPRRALAVGAATVAGLNWLGEGQTRVEAKVRSLARPVGATLYCSPAPGPHQSTTLVGPKPGAQAGEARVAFDCDEYGVAPGQSAVFYDGERLLGGGTIVATEAAEQAEVAAA